LNYLLLYPVIRLFYLIVLYFHIYILIIFCFYSLEMHSESRWFGRNDVVGQIEAHHCVAMFWKFCFLNCVFHGITYTCYTAYICPLFPVCKMNNKIIRKSIELWQFECLYRRFFGKTTIITNNWIRSINVRQYRRGINLSFPDTHIYNGLHLQYNIFNAVVYFLFSFL
jgi:hypothetical protein